MNNWLQATSFDQYYLAANSVFVLALLGSAFRYFRLILQVLKFDLSEPTCDEQLLRWLAPVNPTI
eukprot:2610101-Pleurochrysis_carterae.AAC.1